MISCTEFIPLYSEFFKFMEARGGHEAVVRYWEHISDSSMGDKRNPNSLISFVEKYGFEGTWRYWSHTLTEEACDVLRMYDPVRKTGYSVMRRCPSKGCWICSIWNPTTIIAAIAVSFIPGYWRNTASPASGTTPVLTTHPAPGSSI